MPDPVSPLRSSIDWCPADEPSPQETNSCAPPDPQSACPWWSSEAAHDVPPGTAALTAKFRPPDPALAAALRTKTANGGASGQGEGGGEGTTSGSGYSAAPPGNGYTDYNLTAGAGVGITGGLFVDQYGQVHPYVGGGLVTPGISVSVSEAVTGSIAPDEWSAQYNVSGLGSSASVGHGGGDWFVETGSSFPPTPGQSLTGYYTW